MSELEIFLRIAFFGLALILFVLSILSMTRIKEAKIGLATAGFGLFVIEGVVLTAGIICPCAEELVTTSFLVAINFMALIFLYFSIVKR